MQTISAQIRGRLLELSKNQPWTFPNEPVKVSGGSKAQRALVEGIKPGINKKPNQGTLGIKTLEAHLRDTPTWTKDDCGCGSLQ